MENSCNYTLDRFPLTVKYRNIAHAVRLKEQHARSDTCIKNPETVNWFCTVNTVANLVSSGEASMDPGICICSSM